MTFDQLNQLLNRGEIASALVIIAFVLVFTVFRKAIEEPKPIRSKKK